MKRINFRRTFWGFIAAFVAVFFWNVAWANDFYVIAAADKAKRTVLVSPKNNPDQSGASLLGAISGITDASADNPYLIIIEPGVYDIGTSSFIMKPYVDVQGSGENVTKITGSVSNIPPAPKRGVVEGADHAELRLLTVENTGTSTNVVAIRNDGTSPLLSFVTATVTGGYWRTGVSNNASSARLRNVTIPISYTGSGVAIGVDNEGASNITMENVTIKLTGTSTHLGVDNGAGSTATMRYVNVTVAGFESTSCALQNIGTTTVEHSVLSGPNWLYNNGHVYVANSRIEGNVRYNNNIYTCAGVFDEDYVFYPSSCPPDEP